MPDANMTPNDADADETAVSDEDCYFDGPYLVFTEAYHRKRGYCCQSGCRHCPYGFELPKSQGMPSAGNG